MQRPLEWVSEMSLQVAKEIIAWGFWAKENSIYSLWNTDFCVSQNLCEKSFVLEAVKQDCEKFLNDSENTLHFQKKEMHFEGGKLEPQD